MLSAARADGTDLCENYYSININLGPSVRHTFHVDVSIMHAPEPNLCSPFHPDLRSAVYTEVIVTQYRGFLNKGFTS